MGTHESGWLNAFSDSVIAENITIMAFSLLQPPGGTTLGALATRLPVLLIYLLSFTRIAIYRVSYHHLLGATRRISGAVMWATLHLLFWLSLIPGLTAWLGAHPFDLLPASARGIAVSGATVEYIILEHPIIACNDPDSAVARAIGRTDVRGATALSLYVTGAGLAWVTPWISYLL